MNINQIIASELNATEQQIQSAIQLLDEGATVPFIARYRKEATGGLDDTQLRHLDERLHYLRELLERKATVLKSIEEQGKLTPELQAQIDECDNKTTLEDLYLPYKPKRRTKAQIARENGLQELADSIFRQPETILTHQIPFHPRLKYANFRRQSEFWKRWHWQGFCTKWILNQSLSIKPQSPYHALPPTHAQHQDYTPPLATWRVVIGQ